MFNEHLCSGAFLFLIKSKRWNITCIKNRIIIFFPKRYSWKPYLVKYKDQKIYNFEMFLQSPCIDQTIINLIREREESPYGILNRTGYGLTDIWQAKGIKGNRICPGIRKGGIMLTIFVNPVLGILICYIWYWVIGCVIRKIREGG